MLRVRGDYLAIVTLGFGEVIRVLANNLDKPLNLTNGPQGITPIQRPTLAAAAARRPSVPSSTRWSGIPSPKAISTTCSSTCWRWWSSW